MCEVFEREDSGADIEAETEDDDTSFDERDEIVGGDTEEKEDEFEY